MDYKINDAEFVLLLLIAERRGTNGYQIRQTVTKRGMEAWAGVSTSSIYVMLKKLETRGFVSSKEDVEKRTKGARGQVYSISPGGKAALKNTIQLALSQCREHDPKFNIALSGIENLDCREASVCLKKRNSFLDSELRRLTAVEENQGNLPLSATLLFDHIKYGIEKEVIWLERAISKLADKGTRNDNDT